MQETDNRLLCESNPAWGQAAERVAASAGLARSSRLRNLFLYLCRRTWAGTAEELREHTIGEEVFGRPVGYDTASENIVRVSVSQLRKRLDQYFAGEGASEPIIITIPKGRYSVEFLPREASPPALSTPSQEPPPLPPLRPRTRVLWPWVAAACVVFAALFLARYPWPATTPASAPHERFWSAVFTPGRDTYIVVADSGFGLLQDVTGQTLTLEEYLGGSASTPPDRSVTPSAELTRRLMGRQYTSVSDASIAFQLGQISRAFAPRAVVRSARGINIRDLKTHNIILLGSARSNPWTGLLRDRMNFFLDYEGQPPGGIIRNNRPAPGEAAIYRATARAGQPGDAYGLVAWIPNLDSTGSIVTLAGTNMEGTEAAAELLLNPSSFEKLRTRLGALPSGSFPYFEALIRARSQAGAGSGAEIIAIRKIGGR